MVEQPGGSESLGHGAEACEGGISTPVSDAPHVRQHDAIGGRTPHVGSAADGPQGLGHDHPRIREMDANCGSGCGITCRKQVCTGYAYQFAIGIGQPRVLKVDARVAIRATLVFLFQDSSLNVLAENPRWACARKTSNLTSGLLGSLYSSCKGSSTTQNACPPPGPRIARISPAVAAALPCNSRPSFFIR